MAYGYVHVPLRHLARHELPLLLLVWALLPGNLIAHEQQFHNEG